MPTYQYRCGKCGEQFELWQSIHDDALTAHPGCGGPVIKVLAPAGIVLKGPGFYRTDSRSSSGKSRDRDQSGEKVEKAKKSEGGSDNGTGSGSKDSKDSKATKSEAKTSGNPSNKGAAST
jgi:putative FmdB family regulatory protein